MKKILISGISGFVGSHLAEYLLKQNKTDIYGTIRWRSRMDNIESIKDKIHLIDTDIKDAHSMQNVIDESYPDFIFHLAAQSFVPTSWHAPAETLSTNIIGNVNLLEAIRKSDCNPVIHIAGSSEEYGMVYPNEVPIKETNPLRPMSPYGVSKVTQDLLSRQYFMSYGLKVVVTRAFNHSISKWSPVIIRDDESGIIDIKYISEMRQKQRVGGYLSGELIEDVQRWNLKRYNLSVWSDNGWKKLKSISCHPIRNNKLLKIATRAAIYDVTDNHSILDEKGKEKNAGKSQIGDKIKQSALPIVEIMDIPEDLAWFYGFFVAEGDMSGGRFGVSNTNKNLLEKCRDIMLKYFGKYSIMEKNEGCVCRLYMRRSTKIAKFLRSDFYASDKNKRVPIAILNAGEKAKLAFLDGFNYGDGLIGGYNSEDKFKSFKTVSPILAMGLCYLIENTTKQRYTICIEQREEKIYYAINLNSRYNNTWGVHLKKPQNEIVKIIEMPYSEEVWDFETENNHFHCGIGKGIVHNTGARRGEVFVTSNFAKQVAEIEKGIKEPIIYVGNLTAQRDWTDVRDVVRAYWLAVTKCEYGEVYNICSGKTRTVQSVLNMLLKMSEKDITVKQDPSRMRPSDVEILQGDYSKFKKKTGWKPEIPFEKTMRDLLDFWRSNV